jgi:hypothetical protein
VAIGIGKEFYLLFKPRVKLRSKGSYFGLKIMLALSAKALV